MEKFKVGDLVRVVRLPNRYYVLCKILSGILEKGHRGKARKMRYIIPLIKAYRSSKGLVYPVESVKKEGRWTYVQVTEGGINLDFTLRCLEHYTE